MNHAERQVDPESHGISSESTDPGESAERWCAQCLNWVMPRPRFTQRTADLGIQRTNYYVCPNCEQAFQEVVT